MLGKTAMFNPREFEGEVDHSFFDSDCDDGVNRDDGEKMEKVCRAEKESSPTHERLHAKQKENTEDGWSQRSDGMEKYLKPVKYSSGISERKENSWQLKEEERSSTSSISSVACPSDKVINNSSDHEEASNFHSKRHSGTFMALLADAGEADYSQSQNESEEESLPSKHSGPKGRNKRSPKKFTRNQRTQSPSPTSTNSSVDADSESSYSSSNERSSLDSPTPPRPNKSSLSPGVRTRLGSTGSRDVPINYTEESEDAVTDVSPLSSSDFSPLQSLDLNHTEPEEGSLKEQQQESVPSSGLSDMHQDEDSDQDEDEYSLSSESQLGGKLVFHSPGGRNRKNYSFTNDEVRRIDRENQRLLRELSRHNPGPQSGSSKKKTQTGIKSPHIRLSHSALNRQREQQRIERENLAFLKRLESVKPTPGLRRSEQLADYQRHIGYVGAPSYSVCMSTSRKERSTQTPSGLRPDGLAHLGSRAASITSDSSKKAIPRSKKLSAPRPAWC